LYLNGLRERDYRAAVAAVFSFADWEDGAIEGSDLLTNARKASLHEFSERDLLLSSVTVWARR
jgi:hypothetical protein